MDYRVRAERVLIVTSSGGVALDVMGLRPWWESRDVRWIAVPASDTRELLADHRVDWQDELKPKQVLSVGRSVMRARQALISDTPDVLISAGSGIAVPWFIAARMLNIPSWWVETFNVVGKPGLASRVCASLASLVIVQHQELLARHRRAVFVGALY